MRPINWMNILLLSQNEATYCIRCAALSKLHTINANFYPLPYLMSPQWHLCFVSAQTSCRKPWPPTVLWPAERRSSDPTQWKKQWRWGTPWVKLSTAASSAGLSTESMRCCGLTAKGKMGGAESVTVCLVVTNEVIWQSSCFWIKIDTQLDSLPSL